jgi:hypothetical protein
MVCVVFHLNVKKRGINFLDLFALLNQYAEQRQRVKQLENQLKSVTLKTKSQR